MNKNKWIAFLLMALSIFSPFLSPLTAFAQNGPNLSSGSSTEAYISLLDTDGTPTDLFYAQGGKVSTVSSVAGASYDQKTNTLTLSGFSTSKKLECSLMGDDFTIRLNGKNSLGQITVFGDGYGGSLKIKGNGSLTINKDKAYTDVPAILLRADGATSTFSVAGKASVTLYGTDTTGTLALISTKTANALTAIDAGIAKSKIKSGTNSDSTYDYRIAASTTILGRTASLSKTKITSAKGKTNTIALKWKKVAAATSYQVQISKAMNFKNAASKTFTGNSLTATNLLGKTTYYVRIRCCATKNGKKIFSKWSSKKAVQTK